MNDWRHRLRRNVAAGCILAALYFVLVATIVDTQDRKEEPWL